MPIIVLERTGGASDILAEAVRRAKALSQAVTKKAIASAVSRDNSS